MHSEWSEITVAYSEAYFNWFPWGIAVSVLFSLSISILVCTIFKQKRRHIEDKHRLIVDSATKAARNERDLNEFVAHEVRNPISAALSACSFVSAKLDEVKLLVGKETGARLQEDVAIIESSLKYADDLLHTMLDLHRIDAKEMQLRAVPTDIKHHILHPVASMIQRREDGATFEVTVECQDNLVVSVDRLRLKQIVFHLARNSAKSVKAGGFIRLRARPLSKIDFDGTSDEESGICLYVEDSGPGRIDEVCNSLVFAAYHDTVDAQNQGTGTEFSICKTFMQLMDGKIELDRSYNSGIPGMTGTKFSIRLLCDFAKVTADTSTRADDSTIDSCDTFVNGGEQLVSPNTKATSQSAPPISSLPEHLSVLFVDDDKILRKLFARSLRRVRPEWSLHDVESGEAALELLDKDEIKKYDLIFMDQYMGSPGKRLLGTETVERLRKWGVGSRICGLSANDLGDAFIDAGADAFLMKPFPSKPEELTKTMLELLRLRPPT